MPLFNSATPSLQTATGSIDIASATAPTTGQVLTATSATAATWQTSSSGSPTVQNVTATGATTTTSGTDVVLTTMTITPGAGNYLVMFSCKIQDSSTGQSATFSVYVNGVQVVASEREMRLATASLNYNMALSAYITSVGAGQAVDIRWRVDGGTGSVSNRELILMKAA